jgi:palmitoyl-protein thioesterase
LPCFSYADNLKQLRKLVLVKFADDTVVDPRGTEWFEFFAPGQSETMLPMKETDLYKV